MLAQTVAIFKQKHTVSIETIKRITFRINVSGALAVGNAVVGREQIGVFGLSQTGHKIVLLTITRLVELVVEQSLVLIDEPESHLHPPLLSAFIQSRNTLPRSKQILRRTQLAAGLCYPTE